ncbi:alkene reductase [Shewanella sp. NFH-SH190041]|nr:alkene reductase [Shewanella sp. NFH-SH190041]
MTTNTPSPHDVNSHVHEKCNPLLTPVTLGTLALSNRVIMAPMTRNRASADGVPTPEMVTHYQDRASAGLIVAEGTWPVKAGQAYNRQPGIETPAQIAAWRDVTDAVHNQGGKIVLQIMHAGRIGSHHIKGETTDHIAPSAVQARGEVYTDAAGMQPFDSPRALTLDEISEVVEQHRQAAVNASAAGFDGVELHCTSGYLPMQFLCHSTNQREDEYGGSPQQRCRFALECLAAMVEVFGPGRVGLRVNPGNRFNDTDDPCPKTLHDTLLRQALKLDLAYLHIMRSPLEEIDAFALAKAACLDTGRDCALILNDSFSPTSGADAIAAGRGAAVSFARHFIANPDLVARIAAGQPLAKFDRRTLYTPGAQGYNDYPTMDLAVEA